MTSHEPRWPSNDYVNLGIIVAEFADAFLLYTSLLSELETAINPNNNNFRKRQKHRKKNIHEVALHGNRNL